MYKLQIKDKKKIFSIHNLCSSDFISYECGHESSVSYWFMKLVMKLTPKSVKISIWSFTLHSQLFRRYNIFYATFCTVLFRLCIYLFFFFALNIVSKSDTCDSLSSIAANISLIGILFQIILLTYKTHHNIYR